VILSTSKQVHTTNPLEKALIDASEFWNEEEEKDMEACLRNLDSAKEVSTSNVEELHEILNSKETKMVLKILISDLKYVFIEEKNSNPVIISSSLSKDE